MNFKCSLEKNVKIFLLNLQKLVFVRFCILKVKEKCPFTQTLTFRFVQAIIDMFGLLIVLILFLQ